MNLLEQVLPVYDQREYHETHVAAPPERVWAALDGLRVRDLPLSMLLTRLRGGPAAWFGHVEDDRLDRRALDSVAPRTLVAEQPRELVLGDIACYTAARPDRPEIARGDLAAFLAFAEPGWTKVAMNFRFTAEQDGTLLSTETRVLATDDATRRAFRRYWLLVRAGSGLVRRDILTAVRAAARELATTREAGE
jgi:hypothetical protein